ncbi:redoxin domain-containing protein [Chitinophaga sp. CF418]|uniref:redoxin domain-containing protein n=1 Tax=Chitinophaga sp. CF418 TaxID=1855287 RepID=UPI000919D519|nr:redoxin domain-containing protein [Chitinophaga sp. CF418]SHN77586.1 Thiol-disulfide isomerase or thioredoxin [Chitinophaga sp. CF418]
MSRLFFCALLSGILSVHTLSAQLLASANVMSAGRLKDYNGKTFTVKPAGKPVVYIFLSPECPLCKNYAPVLQGLQSKYKDVQFYGIISGQTFTQREVAEYAKEYNITFPILMDTDKKVANYLNATVTPEALLIGNNGKEYYRGLIDDWVTGLGTKRIKATRKYLELAINNLLTGNELVSQTTPIGCLISNY